MQNLSNFEIKIPLERLTEDRLKNLLQLYFDLKYTPTDMSKHLKFFCSTSVKSNLFLLKESRMTSHSDLVPYDQMYPIDLMAPLILFKLKEKTTKMNYVHVKHQNNILTFELVPL